MTACRARTVFSILVLLSLGSACAQEDGQGGDARAPAPPPESTPAAAAGGGAPGEPAAPAREPAEAACPGGAPVEAPPPDPSDLLGLLTGSGLADRDWFAWAASLAANAYVHFGDGLVLPSSGAFLQSETDLRVPLGSRELLLRRTWSSTRAAVPGPLGPGWAFELGPGSVRCGRGAACDPEGRVTALVAGRPGRLGRGLRPGGRGYDLRGSLLRRVLDRRRGVRPRVQLRGERVGRRRLRRVRPGLRRTHLRR